MKITDKYVFFWRGTFSNWYPARFTMQGNTFENSEQAFMWMKAKFFNDNATAIDILSHPAPSDAKMYGRLIKNYDDAKWSSVRYEFMVECLLAKFSANESLKAQLLDTGGKTLVEASPYDKVWGIGMSEDEAGIENPATWKGLNLLGEALMEVRKNL